MFARIIGIALATLITLLPAVDSCATAPSPDAVVTKLHDALLGAMKQAGTGHYADRYKALEPIVKEIFDFPKIGKIVMGRYWDTWDDKQKNAFMQLFSQLSTATYSSEFNSFDNEKFRHVDNVKLKDDQVLVKTELVKSNGDAVKLDYVVREIDNKWLIVNVTYDGVSDLSLKRADYTAILKDQGFDALMSKLNDKIAQYQKKN